MMKKIIFLMLVCLIVSSVGVMAACEKYEADISNGELTTGTAYVEGTSNKDTFGYTDFDGNGEYDVAFDNYDTCTLQNHPYLEEYKCDGEEADFEVIECEFGCETVNVGQVPFGRCASAPSAEVVEEPGDVTRAKPDVDPVVLVNVDTEGQPDRVRANVEVAELREPIELEECGSKDNVHANMLEIKAKFFEYVKARKLVSMETGINYYNDMGIDTTELVTYKGEVEGVTNWEDLKDAVTPFREAAHQINFENDIVDETLDELIELLRDARNNDLTLVAMHDEIEELALEHRLMVFDARVCIANNAITKLGYHGSDVTDVKADLEAIEDLRDDFKDSIESAQAVCHRGIDICVEEESATYKELKEDIEGMFKDLRAKITSML